jgi:hypothetical protein
MMRKQKAKTRNGQTKTKKEGAKMVFVCVFVFV